MLTRKLIFLFCSFISLPSALAGAEGQSKTKSTQVPINMSYFGTYLIPSVFKESTYSGASVKQPLISNQFFLNYMLSQTRFVGLTFGVDLLPVNFDKSTFHNPGIRIGDYRLINTDVVRLASDLRVVFPVTDRSRSEGMALGFVTQQWGFVYIPKSRFYFDTLLLANYQLYSQVGLGRRFYLFDVTGVNYQLSQNLSLGINGIFQSWLLNQNGASISFDQIKVGPGMTWAFGQFKLNSYFAMSTAQPTLQESTFLVFLSGRVF